MLSFWKSIFNSLGIDMLTATAYHPQTDGQSERTNQTAEIALRYHIAQEGGSWVDVLDSIAFSHNNSVNQSTGYSPTELMFGERSRDKLGYLNWSSKTDRKFLHKINREQAEEAMAYANRMAKRRYDEKHKMIDFKPGDKVYLNLHHRYKLRHGDAHRKLGVQRVGPYKVLKRSEL